MTPFNSIPGQEPVKQTLLNSINKNRLASAYLFYGIDGQGKWAVAIALAALVNCEKPLQNDSGEAIDACGQCRNCHQILSHNFPELHFGLPLPPHRNEAEALALNQEYRDQKREEPYRIISSKRQLTIPIEFARNIKRRTAIKPDVGTTRVILFYQMEKMLPASADSLLKLIEEPPPHTIIVLTAKDPDNLLPTIQSRAHKIRFRPISEELIACYLVEHYDVELKKASFCARLAQGSLGAAIELAEDDDRSSKRQVSFLMFKELILNDTSSAIGALMEFINPYDRGQAEQVLSHWQSFLSDIILLKYGNDESEIVNNDLTAELDNLSRAIGGPNEIAAAVDDIKQISLSLRRNVHIRPALAAFAVRMRGYLSQST
ncbi:MAG: hypothetical protein JSV44_05960 [Candidatus Zixiibacteriota bacterium]|nr:MAG: hypothetical protein JSV44_05960 [candidate division Zixibacteria bacterium]